MSKKPSLAINLQALENVSRIIGKKPYEIMEYYNTNRVLFYSTRNEDGSILNEKCVRVIKGDLDNRLLIDISKKEGMKKYNELKNK